MLGDFLKDFRDKELRALSAGEVKKLAPGTALVAVASPDRLSNGGLPSDIRFAIRAEEADTLIMQMPVSYDWNKPLFQINRFPVDMLQIAHFYTYAADSNLDLNATLQRAEERVDNLTDDLRSFPGDDFVDECITGEKAEDLFARYVPASGQHWWTPLIVDSGFILDQTCVALNEAKQNATKPMEKYRISILQKSLNFLKTRIPKDANLPQVEHHGILIERGRVIHFSAHHIRADLFTKFMDTTDNTPPGGTAAGQNEQAEVQERLYTRNRAVWVFAREGREPGYWGKYNLFLNNCEHFSRACRENRRASCQVIDNSIKALQKLLGVAPLPGLGALVAAVANALLELTRPQDIVVGPVKNKHAHFNELKEIIESA